MTLVEELRARANAMREKGMFHWAYLCLTAADHISFLDAEVNEQARLLGDSGSTEARLRDRIKELEALAIQIHDKLEYGDVFGWDDGDDCWAQMRDVKKGFD
jgi:hypothetical protein